MSKKISINPEFFKISGSKKNKKTKKQKPVFDKKKIKPNDIRKKLIQKVKEHQKKEKEREISKEQQKTEIFQNNFEETINYLNQVVKEKKKKKKKKKNKTLKNKIPEKQIPINTEPLPAAPNIPNIPDLNISKDPPYGILKGGSKPTYKQWKKTLRNKDKKHDKITESLHGLVNFDNEKSVNRERIEKLAKIKKKIKREKREKNKIKTKTIKRNITLGKMGGKVSVLVKNKKTRKKLKNEVNILKKKDIQEIKDYLRKHNLIKIGSNSPEYILREIYESAYLSGDVINKNPDILLHNWVKESD